MTFEPAIIFVELICGVDIANNNFQLEITGTDPDSGEPFRYFWSESVNTFAQVPEPTTLALGLLLAAALAGAGRFNRGLAPRG